MKQKIPTFLLIVVVAISSVVVWECFLGGPSSTEAQGLKRKSAAEKVGELIELQKTANAEREKQMKSLIDSTDKVTKAVIGLSSKLSAIEKAKYEVKHLKAVSSSLTKILKHLQNKSIKTTPVESND